MAYTIELSSEEESVVQRRATRLGITPQEYLRRSVGRSLRRGNASLLSLTDDEKQALATLNAQLPVSFWERYAELTEKIRARTLTEAEHAEVRTLAAQEEAWNGARLQWLQQLAQKRNVPLLRLMKHNGIAHHPEADRFLAK